MAPAKMLGGSRVFKDDDLQARALDLCPAAPNKEKNNKKDETDEKKDGKKDEQEKGEKDK